MRYDFRKIQEAINEQGLTLEQIGAKAHVHYTTVLKALKTGRAHQSTALALTKALKVSMKDIQVRSRVA